MKYRLDGFSLKVIAISAMVIDHIAAAFFPSALWMRFLGRITMPVISYMAAESYHHTRSVKNYLYRLLLFAIAAQVPFMLAFDTTKLNVLFTLIAAVSILAAESSRLSGPARLLLIFSLLVFSILCDWALFGVLFVWVFYRFRGNFHRQAVAFSVVALVQVVLTAFMTRDSAFWVQSGVFAAIPILSLYNGRRGRDMRYFFYIFYPAHLAVIVLIKYLL